MDYGARRIPRRQRNHRGFRAPLEEFSRQPAWASELAVWIGELPRPALAEALRALRWVVSIVAGKLRELEAAERQPSATASNADAATEVQEV